ncbi:MAG: FitA-like ribbon-helix-helix domain-containing protein [Terriglobia bacterium]
MANLHIRNLPEFVRMGLRFRAVRKGWSMEAEARTLLANARTGRVSIHAPARGATGGDACAKRLEKVSIHAPARGATDISGNKNMGITVSIHAPARGAT